MSSQGNTPVRVMYSDSEFAPNGPKGADANNNPKHATTVSDNGSAMQLTINIGSHQFPIVVSTEDFWDPVAPVAYVPVVMDLTKLTESENAKIAAGVRGFDFINALDSMEVYYTGTLSNLETPDPSVAFGVEGNTVGRAKSTKTRRVDMTDDVGNTRVFVGRHGQKKMKRLIHDIAFASLSSRRRFDRPINRGRKFSLALSQLPYPQYVLPLVVVVHLSYHGNGYQHRSRAFVSDNFAVAYRLDSTMSLVFPQTSMKLRSLHNLRESRFLHCDDRLTRGPLGDWVKDALQYQTDREAMACKVGSAEEAYTHEVNREFAHEDLSIVNNNFRLAADRQQLPRMLIPGRTRLISRVGMGEPITLHPPTA